MRLFIRANVVAEFSIDVESADDIESYSNGDLIDAIVNADRMNVVEWEVVDVD